MQETEITGREGEKLQEERIIEIETERLRDFRNHPFRISPDKPMEELMESIQRYGVLNPLIVRPMPEGVYEIISGHRRKYAAQMLGFRKVPVVIRVMSDDEAIIKMVDSNLQRQQIRFSEKALAIKMKYEAMKRIPGSKKGSRDGHRKKGQRTVQIIGETFGESPKQIQRYLKIADLIPELLEKLDKGDISFNPAYEIAFLKENEQKMFLEAMKFVQSVPSVSQAQRIKKMSQDGELTVQKIKTILSELKKGAVRRVIFKNEQLYQFFPRRYTPEQMQEEILIILRQWKKQREKNKNKGD